MPRKTLTAIMMNYNDSATIGAAIEAVCTQSRQPDVFVVVDDGSTDNSIEIVNSYIEKYPFLRLHRNEKNMGIIAGFNNALKKIAACDYLYWAASNDRILPGFFERAMALLEANPQAGLFCADTLAEDFLRNTVEEGRKHWLNEPGYISADQLVQKYRAGLPNVQPYLFPITAIFRYDLMMQLGQYHPELRWHCDWFGMQAMAFRGGVCYAPDPVAVTRLNANSYSAGVFDVDKQTEIFHQIVKRLTLPCNRDVAPYFRHSHMMRCMELSIVDRLGVVLSQFKQPANWFNSEYYMLAAHFAQERFDKEFWNDFQRKSKEQQQNMGGAAGGAARSVAGRVRNLFDQAYAQAFHHYDKLRKCLRGQ